MASSAAQLRLPLERHDPPRRVVSDSNRAAVDVLDRFPAAPGAILALIGPAGSGKSEIAAAWAERVAALPLHGAEIAVADPLELEGRAVLLDAADQADDESLFHLINLVQSGGGALLMVARDAPATWSAALPDLVSRLAAAPVVAIDAPDDALLAAILRARFAERSLVPPGEVLAYLVARMPRSATAAAEIVDRLDRPGQTVNRTRARVVLDALS